MKLLLQLFLVLILLSACRTTVCGVSEESSIHDTIFITKTKHDSIAVRDSIYFYESVKGDTIRLITDRWHTEYRDRWIHDSIYIAKTDTMYKVIVEKVEREPTLFEKMKSVLCLAGVGVILFVAFTLWIRHK